MPVYHFTLHAYRSWRPDNPRGYVHNCRGPLPPDSEMADRYDADAKFPPVTFDEPMQRLLIRVAHDVCRRNRWRLHASGNELTHSHMVVSWRTFNRYEAVAQRLKGNLSFALGKEIGPRGRRWFTRGQSERRVFDRPHFDHLVGTYLPDHRGVYWREGWPLL